MYMKLFFNYKLYIDQAVDEKENTVTKGEKEI